MLSLAIALEGHGRSHALAGDTDGVVIRQLDAVLSRLGDRIGKAAIAYEPVWAIGTGKTATPEIAADAHKVIRREMRNRYGNGPAADVRILYGGSVKPDNVKSLMAQDDIDGVLVGGASLDAKSFATIVNFTS